MSKTRTLLLNGKLYDCLSEGTILDALLRQKVPVPHSCLKCCCQSGMMQLLKYKPSVPQWQK